MAHAEQRKQWKGDHQGQDEGNYKGLFNYKLESLYLASYTCSIQLDLGHSRCFTVELANFTPNFMQVEHKIGVEVGIEVGPKLAYRETPYCICHQKA